MSSVLLNLSYEDAERVRQAADDRGDLGHVVERIDRQLRLTTPVIPGQTTIDEEIDRAA